MGDRYSSGCRDADAGWNDNLEGLVRSGLAKNGVASQNGSEGKCNGKKTRKTHSKQTLKKKVNLDVTLLLNRLLDKAVEQLRTPSPSRDGMKNPKICSVQSKMNWLGNLLSAVAFPVATAKCRLHFARVVCFFNFFGLRSPKTVSTNDFIE